MHLRDIGVVSTYICIIYSQTLATTPQISASWRGSQYKVA